MQQSVFQNAEQVNAESNQVIHKANYELAGMSYEVKKPCKHRDLNGWCAKSNRPCPLFDRISGKHS